MSKENDRGFLRQRMQNVSTKFWVILGLTIYVGSYFLYLPLLSALVTVWTPNPENPIEMFLVVQVLNLLHLIYFPLELILTIILFLIGAVLWLFLSWQS